MGILTKWRERKSLMSYDEAFRELLQQAGAKSGVRVTWQTALQASVALSCVKKLANGVSQVPMKLFRESADGGRAPEKSDPRYDLLCNQPNDLQTAYEFWEQRMLHLALCGNAFAYKVRVGNRIVELLPYQPGQVTVVQKGWDVSYGVTTVDGRRLSIPKEDMWHSRGLSWDGVRGLEGIKLAREAIGLSLATENHGALMFSNGAQPGGVLSTDQELKEDQRKLLRDSWRETTSGDKKFSTAVLWSGLKWDAMSTPNDQAQFLETRRFQVEETCRFFDMLPIMVGHADKSQTYASAEQMFLAHLVHTLCPWYARLEQSANFALLSPAERSKGLYFKFVVNALMRGTAKDRAQFYKDMYGIAALNPNEIRALEELNPYDGGNEYRAPLNMEKPGDPSASGDETNPKGDNDANA